MSIGEEQKLNCSGANGSMVTARCALNKTKYIGQLIIDESQCNKANKVVPETTDLLSISEVT